MQSRFSFFVNSSIVIEKNTVVSEQTINAEGATVTTPINRNGHFTANLSGYFNKQFKKRDEWQFSVSTSVSSSAAHNFFIVNQQNGYQNTQVFEIKPGLTANWHDVISLYPSYVINYATTQYKLVNYPGTNYTTQGGGMVVSINLPKDFTWRADYTYKHNPLVAPGFQQNTNLLNLLVSKRIQEKGRGEIGLVCYDILNQSVNSYHYVSANSITDGQSQVQKRYVMLTYTYHFKKFQ
jgi:Outer membrane protein beta-barrel family